MKIKPNEHKRMLAMASFVCLLLVCLNTLSSPTTPPMAGRLVRLVVEGDQAVATMLANFLTHQGFVLVVDDQVPVLSARAERRQEGHDRECTVSYHLQDLSLRMPDGGILYIFSEKSTHDYGPVDQAQQSALHLLQAYLQQDRTLMERLNTIQTAPYFHVVANPSADRDRELETLRQTLLALTVERETHQDVQVNLHALMEGQIANRQLIAGQERLLAQVTALAERLAQNNQSISETKIARLVAENRRILRSQNQPFNAGHNCQTPQTHDLDPVVAVLIRVPLKPDQVMVTGAYGLYSAGQKRVAPGNPNWHGPRYFSNMSRLVNSSLGHLFEIPQRYVTINAMRYHPEDRAIIISDCDAETILRAMRHNVQIIDQSRIVVLPITLSPPEVHTKIQ